jgi:hypothetical protein
LPLGNPSPGFETLSITVIFSFSKTVLLVAGLGWATAGGDAIHATEAITNAPYEQLLRVIMGNFLLVEIGFIENPVTLAVASEIASFPGRFGKKQKMPL